MSRFQDAYAVLQKALDTTSVGCPRYYHLLNEVAAIALDFQDIERIPLYMDMILQDAKAPVDLFLHYVSVSENWYNRGSAIALLEHAAVQYPRIKEHADYSVLLKHFNLGDPLSKIEVTKTPRPDTPNEKSREQRGS